MDYKRLAISLGAGVAGAVVVSAIGAQKSYVLAAALVVGAGGALIQRQSSQKRKMQISTSSDAKNYFDEGKANSLLEQHEQAIECFSKAIIINAKDPTFFSSRAASKTILGQHEEALKDYDYAIELKPDCPEQFICRGRIKEILGDTYDAIEDYSIAINLDFSCMQAYAMRGKAYKDCFEFDDAESDLNKAIELGSNDIAIRKMRGYLRERKGDMKGAIEDYTITANAKETFDNYQSLGDAQFALGDYASAIKYFDKAILLDADNISAHFALGNTYMRLKNYSDALVCYTNALENSPSFASGFLNRGIANYALNQLADACSDWMKAKELGSEDAQDLLDKHCN